MDKTFENYETEEDGTGVIVAVLDSGININHPAFRSYQVKGVTVDYFGHGTPVAALIGGHDWTDAWAQVVRPRGKQNHYGGAPGVTLLSIPILDENGIGSDKRMKEAIVEAVDEGAHIINISAGTTVPCGGFLCPVKPSLEYARSKGVIVITAMGNYGDEMIPCPARHSDLTIGVGAHDWNGRIPTFSGRERLYVPILKKGDLMTPYGVVIKDEKKITPAGTKRFNLGHTWTYGGGDCEYLYLASSPNSIMSDKWRKLKGDGKPVTVNGITRGGVSQYGLATKGTSFSCALATSKAARLIEREGSTNPVWKMLRSG